jgi:hypothetical protein
MMSEKVSAACAHLCATTLPTPPAPIISTLAMAFPPYEPKLQKKRVTPTNSRLEDMGTIYYMSRISRRLPSACAARSRVCRLAEGLLGSSRRPPSQFQQAQKYYRMKAGKSTLAFRFTATGYTAEKERV